MSFAVSFKHHSLSDLELENQRFANKTAIKPWLLSCLLASRNIHIVIERSDKHKIIFKCKPPNGYKQEVKHKRRQNSCPFKIRANYSIRNQVWTLLVINDQHDHSIGKSPITIFEEDEVGEEEEEEEEEVEVEVEDEVEEEVEEEEEVVEEVEEEVEVVEEQKHFPTEAYQETNPGYISSVQSSRPSPESSKNSSASDVFSLFMPATTISSPNSIKGDVELMDNLELMTRKKPAKKRKNSREMFEERKREIFEDRKRDLLFDDRKMFDEPGKSLTLAFQTLETLRDEVNAIINKRITDNNIFSTGEKSELMKQFVSQFLTDRKISISKGSTPLPETDETSSNRQFQNQKSDLTSWLTTTPNTNPAGLGSNNANLIPLSPLLNDDADPSSAGSGNHASIDNLTQLPGLNILSASTSNPILSSNSLNHVNQATNHNFTIPNQVPLLQVHHQAQQLPSFNTIQNQLPLSPNSLSSTSTPSLFGASAGSSLIPGASNNSNNNTLSPANLLKSNKNMVASNQQLSNLLNLSEFKLNNSGNNSFLFSGHSSHNYFGTTGLSSPNNNIISQASIQNREHSHSQNQGSGSNNHSGSLNLSSLTDSGW